MRTLTETPKERRKRLGKSPILPAVELAPDATRTRHQTPATKVYHGAGTSCRTMETIPETRQTTGGKPTEISFPWGLWTDAAIEKKDMHVTQGSVAAILDVSRRYSLDKEIQAMKQGEFERKAWMQGDKFSSAWVTACPKTHSLISAKQFPVIAQTYFGVAQQCLEGMAGQPII